MNVNNRMEAEALCAETKQEVMVEAELPFWVDSDDVRVSLQPDHLHVEIRGADICCKRSYWKPRLALSP